MGNLVHWLCHSWEWVWEEGREIGQREQQGWILKSSLSLLGSEKATDCPPPDSAHYVLSNTEVVLMDPEPCYGRNRVSVGRDEGLKTHTQKC
jgi:hypothetical protein